MRSWWFIALVIVGGLVAQPSDAWAGGPDETAFRGIKWGAKCSTVPGFQSLTGNQQPRIGTGHYWRPTERLTIGAARLERVVFICENDSLSTVSIDVEKAEKSKLIEELTAAWGSPFVLGGDLYWYSPTKMMAITSLGTIEVHVVSATFLVSLSNLQIANQAVKQQLMKVDGARIRKDL